MAIPTSGSISIKEAAGSTRSIDTAVTSTVSGSLVTLSTNSTQWTGSTRTSITADTDSAPYSMLEFSGYSHTWSTTGTVESYIVPKNTLKYKLNLVDNTPDNVGGTLLNVRTYRLGGELVLQWSGSLNTSWSTIHIGPSSSNYTTLSRTGNFNSSGTYHYTGSSSFGTTGSGESGSEDTSPIYITNTNGASMYFRIIA